MGEQEKNPDTPSASEPSEPERVLGVGAAGDPNNPERVPTVAEQQAAEAEAAREATPKEA